MNKAECDKLIDSYVEWLRSGLSTECLEAGCELTTPFLDRHNDHLQVYAVRKGNEIVLTDDGYILSDLRTSGLELSTDKRRSVLEATLNGFGVKNDDGRLVAEATERNLGQRLHVLVQAMLAVNDMFVMAQPRVASFFWEDVRAFLDLHEVRYSTRIKLTGKSGFDHAVDFLIPRSRQRPERILQVINAPTRNSIGNYLFTLGDTRDARESGSEAYAALNDLDKSVSAEVTEALKAYEVNPILWSEREQYAEALAS